MRKSAVTNRQSALPVPMRVQDGIRAGLATPQTKERPGLGKLSMTKPVSGTSERKTSFFGKRASGSRNSQYGAIGGSEKIKDPRPLHDKAFIQQCIRQLCEFLNENGYSQTLTVKSLQCPSTKDFLKIFAFIYSFICTNYELPGTKFEEEIPCIFKDLGYPFPLSKSSMYTVGAPHTWPQIVAALVWLIDCVKLMWAIKQNDYVFGETPFGEESDNGIDFNQVFLDYTVKCYDQFMEGSDTHEEADAELCAKLKSLYAVDESHLESLQAKIQSLEEEIENLEREKDREPDRMASMRKLKASLQNDIQKYQNYLNEVESHSALMDQRVSVVTDELEATELEFEAMKQENLRLKNILDHQKYSLADIERFKYEENEVKETCAKLSKELDDAKQILWGEELRYAKNKELVDTEIEELHKLGRKLRVIPSSAENAHGYDLQIDCNLDSEESLHHCRNQMNLPLLEMLTQSEDQITKAVTKKMEIQEVNEQLRSLNSDQRNDLKKLKDEAQRLEELLLQKTKDAEEQENKWESELQSLEKHCQLLESGVSKGLEETMKDLERAQQELQLVELQAEEENRQVGKKLDRVVTGVASHVAAIEKHVQEISLRTKREHEAFMQQDPLANLRGILAKYKQKAELLDEPPSQ